MKHLKLILSILFIFCLTRTYADDSNYLFRHYQVENGLSDNMATCCVQDRKGYIWIGTRDGLNRFDGYTFKVFRNDPDETETLGSNWITCLGCDMNGDLWVGTLSGLYQYDDENHLVQNPSERLLSTHRLRLLHMQSQTQPVSGCVNFRSHRRKLRWVYRSSKGKRSKNVCVSL